MKLRPPHTLKKTSHSGLSAFTLVEILVVISIIAVLATLVLSVMRSSKETSARVNCASNMRQLGSLLLAYAGENGALPNGASWDRDISVMGGVHDQKLGWKLLKCHSDKRVQTASFNPRSYAASAMSSVDNGRGVFGRASATVISPSRPLAQITDPSNTIMLMENYTGNNANNQQFKSAFAYGDGWLGGNGPLNPNGSSYHGIGNNYLFCDGHVETQKVPGIYNPKAKLNRWLAF